MKTVIIQGSSRNNGNTHKVSVELQKHLNCDIINLKDKNIGHYDYEYNNQEDDFPALIEKIATNYDLIIFASPVYWYTMSGLTKVFFDRISDTIRISKDTGRKLRGKKMAALSCGYGSDAIEGFFLPFQRPLLRYTTCRYRLYLSRYRPQICNAYPTERSKEKSFDHT